MIILVIIDGKHKKEVVGIGQFHTALEAALAEIALVVGDDYQNKGIGRELFAYLVELARNNGVKGFEALVQMDNWPMLHLCETIALYDLEKTVKSGIYELKMHFHKY
jgi:acetyltransferase